MKGKKKLVAIAQLGIATRMGGHIWMDKELETAPTLIVGGGDNKTTFVFDTYAIQESRREQNGKGISKNVMYTINTIDVNMVAYPIESNLTRGTFKICQNGIFQTLLARMGTGGNQQPMVLEKKDALEKQAIYDVRISTEGTKNQRTHCFPTETSRSLDTEPQDPNTNQGGVAIIEKEQNVGRYIVRRITPLECERLQGFPDNWTDIGMWKDSKGKLRDSVVTSRYKAIGNSMAVPVMKWIAERIDWALASPITKDTSKKEYIQGELF